MIMISNTLLLLIIMAVAVATARGPPGMSDLPSPPSSPSLPPGVRYPSPPPPTLVDCSVSGWSGYGSCSASCGGGTMSRTRYVEKSATGGGTGCPSLFESTQCNTQGCPVNCSVSGWSGYSSCSTSCGGGTMSRTRQVSRYAAYGGTSCPILSESTQCNTQGCPVDCLVSDWSGYGSCSASCGGGTMSRTRYVKRSAANGGTSCPGLSESTQCNTQGCPGCSEGDGLDEGSQDSKSITKNGSNCTAEFNYVAGVTIIGGQYQFTNASYMEEASGSLLTMGSNMIKMQLNKYSGGVPGVITFVDLFTMDPSYAQVLDAPFQYYMFWSTYIAVPAALDRCETSSNTLLDADLAKTEYDMNYELALHLFQTQGGSGKTFFFGHWEGDWYLSSPKAGSTTVSAARFQCFIQFINIRSDAVEDARKAAGAYEGVEVYTYTEVNLVQRSMAGIRSLTDSVLPHVKVDFVSYSSWDSTTPGGGNMVDTNKLRGALTYIQSKLPPRPNMPNGSGFAYSKRVFIGEFGYTTGPYTESCQGAKGYYDPQLAVSNARSILLAGLNWGCPFVVYWSMYASKDQSELGANGDLCRMGYWTIDDTGAITPTYLMLQRFYQKSMTYVQTFIDEHGRQPSAVEFSTKAQLVLNEQDTVLDAAIARIS